jgi:hypothetical protein
MGERTGWFAPSFVPGRHWSELIRSVYADDGNTKQATNAYSVVRAWQ